MGWLVLSVLFGSYAVARALGLHMNAYGLRWVYRIIFALLLSAVFLGVSNAAKRKASKVSLVEKAGTRWSGWEKFPRATFDQAIRAGWLLVGAGFLLLLALHWDFGR